MQCSLVTHLLLRIIAFSQDSVLSHEGLRNFTPILAVQVYFIAPFHHNTKPNHWFSFLSIKYIFRTRFFFQLGLTGLYLSFQIKASFRQFKIWKFRIRQRKAEIIASKYYATRAVRIITDISYNPAGKAAATVLSTTWLFQDCRCLAVLAPKTRCKKEHLGKLFLFFFPVINPATQRFRSIQKVTCDVLYKLQAILGL